MFIHFGHSLSIHIRIDLAQDRDQWSALVNTVMKFLVP
jgi:hypothetical protein